MLDLLTMSFPVRNVLCAVSGVYVSIKASGEVYIPPLIGFVSHFTLDFALLESSGKPLPSLSLPHPNFRRAQQTPWCNRAAMKAVIFVLASICVSCATASWDVAWIISPTVPQGYWCSFCTEVDTGLDFLFPTSTTPESRTNTDTIGTPSAGLTPQGDEALLALLTSAVGVEPTNVKVNI